MLVESVIIASQATKSSPITFADHECPLTFTPTCPISDDDPGSRITRVIIFSFLVSSLPLVLVAPHSVHAAVWPRSTTRTDPTEAEESSQARKRTARAISSGCIGLPPGIPSRNACRSFGSVGSQPSIIGVRVPPGQTALTRMFCVAYAKAIDLVNWITPPLAAQ